MDGHFQARLEALDGRRTLVYSSPRYLSHWLSKLPVNAKLSVTITDKRPSRSNQQNRFYWAYLTMIADETGHSKDDLHTFFKGKFLTSGMTEIYGHKVRKVPSTTTLTKGQFVEYMIAIYDLTGVELPSPENYDFAPIIQKL